MIPTRASLRSKALLDEVSVHDRLGMTEMSHRFLSTFVKMFMFLKILSLPK